MDEVLEVLRSEYETINKSINHIEENKLNSQFHKKYRYWLAAQQDEVERIAKRLGYQETDLTD